MLEAFAVVEASGGAAVDAAVFAAADGRPRAWELVFSSAAAELPLLGGFLNGYLPNEEILRWDLAASEPELDLQISTLPFFPKITVKGRGLSWDEAAQQLSYRVKDDRPVSTWRIIFLDAEAGVIAARSSVTGLNIIKRED